MQKTSRKLSWVVVAMGVIASGNARAASAEEIVRAKVPFAFIAGGTRLPAGRYVFVDGAGVDGSNILSITSTDGRRVVAILTIPSTDARTAREQAQLTFEKFNSEYFLAGVHPVGDDGRAIILTPAVMQRELVAALARADRAGEIVNH